MILLITSKDQIVSNLYSWPGFFHLNNIFGRSLAACELLYNAGYKNLFWVQGGLDSAEEEVSRL